MPKIKKRETIEERRARLTENTRRYRRRHPKRVKKLRRKQYITRKVRAMNLVGGAKCVRCGCDEIDFLEFNHKNGGGCQELMGGEYRSMQDRILSRGRGVDDLEVLCRVCNALEYLERKNKGAARHYKVTWKRYANYREKTTEKEA